MYDLIVMPITLRDGRQVPPGPGLIVLGAPRRAVRSRAEDLLILSITVSDSDRFSLKNQEAWLDGLAQSFFKTSGSVTTALRMLIESINLTMLEKNLKSPQAGISATGAINLIAIHRQAVYIAQSGSTHAYVLNPQGLQHFYDTNQTDRDLGLSRTPTIRYYQSDIGDEAYLFLTAQPPETWTEERLFSGDFPSREQLRRRLLNQTPANFRLELVEIQPGEGKIETTSTFPQTDLTEDSSKASQDIKKEGVGVTDQAIASPFTPESSETLEETQEINIDEPQTDVAEISFDEPETPGEVKGELESELSDKIETEAPPDDEDEPAEMVEVDVLDGVAPSEVDGELEPAEDVEEKGESQVILGDLDSQKSQVVEEPPTLAMVEEDQQKTTRTKHIHQSKQDFKADFQKFRSDFINWKDQFFDKILTGLSGFFKWWHSTREKAGGFFNKLLARSSVGDRGGLQISRGTMLVIAVVVPLVIVLIASGFYLARGRNQQYDYYFEQAQLASTNAQAATDQTTQRIYWNEALAYLDQAEVVRESNEINQLRDTVKDALDALEGALRLPYQPAIMGVLNEDIRISRMVAYGPDLFLLDTTAGRVIHAVLGDQGFEIDLAFNCEPGSYPGGVLESLVDMVSMPINNPYQAQVLAIDASGNIAFCGTNEDPLVKQLPSQGLNVVEIKRIAYDVNYLYALDMLSNNILVYRPTNYQFLDPPTLYFEGEDLNEKPDLNQIVDLAVNGSDLYLLRSDGMIANCQTSGFSENPVSCVNPVSYVDGRLGREEQNVVMPESSFNAVLVTAPPDPAISILDASSGDIYRLSLRFRLYQLLRPDLRNFEVQSTTATAFTIGSNRFAYIAFGNQVFYAYIE